MDAALEEIAPKDAAAGAPAAPPRSRARRVAGIALRAVVAVALLSAAALFAATHPGPGGVAVGASAVGLAVVAVWCVARAPLLSLGRLMLIMPLVAMTVTTTLLYQRDLDRRASFVKREGGRLLWPGGVPLGEIGDARWAAQNAADEATYAEAIERLVGYVREREPGWPHAIDAVAGLEPDCGAAPIHGQAAFTCGTGFLSSRHPALLRLTSWERSLLRPRAEALAEDFDELAYVAFWETELQRARTEAERDRLALLAWWDEVQPEPKRGR